MAEKREAAWFADGDAYEHYVERWSRPAGQMFLDWLALVPDLRCADVGCGTGAFTETMRQQSNPEHILGIEPSKDFLAIAKTRVTDDRADFSVGNALSFSLENDNVDIVVSGLVFNLVPDKSQALKEMLRVVKPAGTLAAYVWDYAGEMQLMRHFWNGVSELFFQMARQKTKARIFQFVGRSHWPTCSTLQVLMLSRRWRWMRRQYSLISTITGLPS